MKWTLITLGGVVLLAGAAILFLVISSPSDELVTLTLDTSSSAFLGDPFDLDIMFRNDSDVLIDDITISMLLPQGASLYNENRAKRAFTQHYGSLQPGEVLEETLPLILFDNEQPDKEFVVTVSYRPPGLGPQARLETERVARVLAGEPAVFLTVETPSQILNNEDFDILVHYENQTLTDFSDVEFTLSYPSAFTFRRASVTPQPDRQTWVIPSIPAAATGTIAVTGTLKALEGSFFEVLGGVRIDGYTIQETAASLGIAASPLTLTINVNNRQDYITYPGDSLQYLLTYRNNSDATLNDVVIEADLSGAMYNFSTMRTDGSFNSLNRTVTWNAASVPDLRLLPPQGVGSVAFEVNTRPEYPITRVSDKNFTLNVDAEISSPTVPTSITSQGIVGIASLVTKVAGAINVDASVLFNEPDALFNNAGALPPRTNTQTQFTVHWKLTNFSTDVSNVEISAFLQSGISWTGNVKSTIEALPVYNPRTQEVSWRIDNLPATRGVISAPPEVLFQVEAVPSITHVGRSLPILGETRAKARDTFTDTDLFHTAQELTTQSVPNISPQQWIVVQ